MKQCCIYSVIISYISEQIWECAVYEGMFCALVIYSVSMMLNNCELIYRCV